MKVRIHDNDGKGICLEVTAESYEERLLLAVFQREQMPALVDWSAKHNSLTFGSESKARIP